jgi:hypothetical protein
MLVTAEEPQIRNKHKPLRCILQGQAVIRFPLFVGEGYG